jgi:hypothetical protein
MGTTVEAYLAALYEWWDAVLLTARCPHCHGLYRRHQTRERAAWDDCDHAQRLLVLRVRCPVCDRTATVLPDFLTPYRRYRSPVREAVVTGEDPAPPCDARTARRWQVAFASALPLATHAVTAWLLTEARPLSRQEPRLLTGACRGVPGLRQLRDWAQQQGRAPAASGLFGWLNREFGQQQAWCV